MVLLPRVGQPKRSKVAQYRDADVFMLSDCVIALMCQNPESAELLWQGLTVQLEFAGARICWVWCTVHHEPETQSYIAPPRVLSFDYCVARPQ